MHGITFDCKCHVLHTCGQSLFKKWVRAGMHSCMAYAYIWYIHALDVSRCIRYLRRYCTTPWHILTYLHQHEYLHIHIKHTCTFLHTNMYYNIIVQLLIFSIYYWYTCLSCMWPDSSTSQSLAVYTFFYKDRYMIYNIWQVAHAIIYSYVIIGIMYGDIMYPYILCIQILL